MCRDATKTICFNQGSDYLLFSTNVLISFVPYVVTIVGVLKFGSKKIWFLRMIYSRIKYKTR